MQPRLLALAHLNQRLLSREARPGLRELGGGVVGPREFRVDVPVEEEDGAADRGDREDTDNDHRSDQNRDPGSAGAGAHFSS